jgi:translation initiation factor 6
MILECELMAIHILNIYNSPNIGIFIKGNDEFLFHPHGLVKSKVNKLSTHLNVRTISVSINGLRLLGPLIVMNNKGILVSGLATEDEIKKIKNETRLPVERAPSRHTAIGNLVLANDHGAIISEVLPNNVSKTISEVLDIPVKIMGIAAYHQIGAMAIATNSGVVVHPQSSETEIEDIQRFMKVDTEPSTVNGGIPYIASGLVANSKNAIVGNLTSGPELFILSRALKL